MVQPIELLKRIELRSSKLQNSLMALLFASTTMLSAVGVTAANAQQADISGVTVSANKARMNRNTVKIVSGKSSGTLLPIVEDMATVLDDGDNLRILAIIGKGSAQNIADTLFLKGIDMGITHANVMNHFKNLNSFGPGLEDRLVYISTLFNEEVHILARSGVTELGQLAGKTVNFGEPGTGTNLTARAVFNALKVNVRPVFYAQADAIEKVRSGEIAATVMLAGKPAGAIQKLRDGGDFSLVPIPFDESLENDYLPSVFTGDDYPDLVAEDVDTIAVPAVLASYNWKPGGDRHRRLATFVDAFFGKFKEFRAKPRHPKWAEVNIYAPLRGWKRFPYAQRWLDKNKPAVAARPVSRPAVAAAGPATFRDFIGGQGGAAAQQAPDGVDPALFQQFLRWKQSQGGSATASGGQVPSSASRTPPATRAQPGGRLW